MKHAHHATFNKSASSLRACALADVLHPENAPLQQCYLSHLQLWVFAPSLTAHDTHCCVFPLAVWLSSNQKRFQVSPESAANSHGSTLQLLSRSTATCLLIIHKAAEEDTESFISQNLMSLKFRECCVGKCRPTICLKLKGFQKIWMFVIWVNGLFNWPDISWGVRSFGVSITFVTCLEPFDQVCLRCCFLRTWSPTSGGWAADEQLLPVKPAANASAPARSPPTPECAEWSDLWPLLTMLCS